MFVKAEGSDRIISDEWFERSIHWEWNDRVLGADKVLTDWANNLVLGSDEAMPETLRLTGQFDSNYVPISGERSQCLITEMKRSILWSNKCFMTVTISVRTRDVQFLENRVRKDNAPLSHSYLGVRPPCTLHIQSRLMVSVVQIVWFRLYYLPQFVWKTNLNWS